MKAIVTIINDYNEVVETNKVFKPIDEFITITPKDSVPIKTSVLGSVLQKY